MAEIGRRVRRPALLLRMFRPALPPGRPLPLWELQDATRPHIQAALRRRAGGLTLQDTVLCRVLGRYKAFVDAADATHAPHLAMDGYWEPATTAFLARNVARGETVVDGGACYGYFSLLLADLVGPSGRLLAFEPHPRLHRLLERNLRLNGLSAQSRSLPVALAARTAAALRFRQDAESPMNSHVLPADLAGASSRPAPDDTHGVSAVTLDSLAASPVHFVKLDICGAEEAALHGADRLLEANAGIRLLLNFNPSRCLAPAELLARLEKTFPLRRLEPDGRARRTTAETLLQAEDSMLFLSRTAPH